MLSTSLDYGNTQLTNQIPSLEVTIFVSYLFRGNYFAALCAEPRELRDLVSLGALVVAPSLRSERRQPRALGSLNRVVPRLRI